MGDNDKVILIPGSDNQDNVKVEITRKAAYMSELMKSMLADDDDPSEVPEIPLLEVSKDILDKVVEFLNRHKDDPMKEISKPIQTNNLVEIVGDWDANFIDLEQEKLFKVILAANYLDIPSLLDLGICKIACMVKGKEPDEVKKMFNIELDITPEEEKMVREANPWIFEVNPTTTGQ
jgi:S-phase kinase-associated protein 1